MFNYYCVTCGSPAKKPACEAARAKEGGEKSPSMGTLGTWHCSGSCKGKVKVKRQKR